MDWLGVFTVEVDRSPGLQLFYSVHTASSGLECLYLNKKINIMNNKETFFVAVLDFGTVMLMLFAISIVALILV